MSKEKYIGEAALKDKPGKKLTLVIKDGSVTTNKIADENVTTKKVANEAITNPKIAELAITDSKLGDSSVIERTINEGAVTTSKIASGAVETDKIANENVTNEKLAGDSVTTNKIKNESVTTEKLAESSVGESKIQNGAVTNDKIANDSLTRDKLDPELRNTLDAATGLPEDLMETIQNVDKTLKDHQSQLDDKQSQIDDKQQQITANDEDISLLQTRSTQMEEAIKGISASGGASQATAVTYENTESGLDSITAQGAIDELANKKFNKENIAQEFGDSKDKVVSQFALPFREIESPEFIKAIVDTEDHFLFGIQLDGSIEWGKGIPSPIRAKLQEIINQCQQDKTDILEAINAAKEELSASITALQEGKVDKEEGKSLIEDEVKECFRVIENEEFLKAIVDSDDKVLFGFYRATGEPYYPLNEMYHVIQNVEYFAAWVTTDDKVVLGIRRDGEIIGEIHAVNALKKVISQLQADLASLQEKVGTIDTNLKELLDVFSFQDNPEYMAVEKDADGKVLSATYNDGSHYIHNAKSETIPTEFEHIEDPEGRTEITTDAENKVMSYRDSSGKKHEHDMEVTNLDVSNINLQGNSVNNIQDALKANGFNVKAPIDWSDNSFIQIPEPRFAIINVTNIDSMPTTKQDNKEAFLEFWDMQGNYFKKHAILNAQGNSSMGWSKKNVSMDICDDEWIGDETPKIRIGDWVPQDSFHLKAYHTDFFKGVGPVAYKLYDQIVKTRGNMYDRPWKKALIDMSAIGTTTKSFENPYVGEYELLTDTGARCFPDGFPVAVYLNGAFYGVFSFQLKKHRDNYHMNKSNAKHVHLDGDIYEASLFNGRNNINWEMFEIRNPKGLYAIGGNKYDADVKQEEIAGEAEVNAWIEAGKLPDGKAIDSKIKKSLQTTAEVKKYIQDFADAMPTIKTARDIYDASSKSEEDLSTLKSIYEKYFDKENMIDYMILSDLIYNYDGFGKNWQWFTYDGVKWWVGLYDTDTSFGGDIYYIRKVPTTHVNTSIGRPNGYVVKYYASEMENRYSELAKLGIISYEHIFSMLKDWTMRIGTSFYKEEYKKWYFCPCISNSTVRSQYWELVKDSSGNLQTDTSETFDATHSYNIGDEVSFGLNEIAGFYKFRCLKATSAISVNKPHSISDYSPISKYGHVDSIYRAEKWIKENVENMDSVYNYNRNV